MNKDNQQSNPPSRGHATSPPSVDGFIRPPTYHSRPVSAAGRPSPGQSIKPTNPAQASDQSTDLQSPDAQLHSTKRASHMDIVPPADTKLPARPHELFSSSSLPQLPEINDEDEPRHTEEPPERDQGLRDVLSVVGVLVCALLLALGLIKFVFQSYQVEGPSMNATLENEDHLIVWKVGKTLANLTGGQYVPNRGDVIIFDEPVSTESSFSGSGKQIIKRVIGLPGERVVFNGTDVTVYNKEHPNGFKPDKDMPYGNKIIFKTPVNDERTLGEDEIYVAGDNRDNSYDSRIFGPLKTDQIVGKLVVRVLPLNDFKLF